MSSTQAGGGPATGLEQSVLVVARHGETHASRVVAQLDRAGCPCFRLDLDRLGTEQELWLRQTGSRLWGGLRCRRTGEELLWSQVAAVFWPGRAGRRAAPAEATLTVGRAGDGGRGPGHLVMTGGQEHAGLWGDAGLSGDAGVLDLLEGVLGRASWLNDRASVRRARLLAVQIQVAADLGLRTPRTLVTANRDDALAFAQAFGPVRLEALGRRGGPPVGGVPTGGPGRVVRPVDLATATSFGAGGPVVLREELLSAQRLWAVVVGDEVFAATLGPTSPARSGAPARPCLHPHRLPALVQRRLVELGRRLRLKWSSVELRLTTRAEHVVERVWPSAPWVWVEDALSVDISGAVAAALIAPVQRLEQLERARQEQGPWVPPVMSTGSGRAVR